MFDASEELILVPGIKMPILRLNCIVFLLFALTTISAKATPSIPDQMIGTWYGYHAQHSLLYHMALKIFRDGDHLSADGLKWCAMSKNQAFSIKAGASRENVMDMRLPTSAFCLHIHYNVLVNSMAVHFQLVSSDTLMRFHPNCVNTDNYTPLLAGDLVGHNKWLTSDDNTFIANEVDMTGAYTPGGVFGCEASLSELGRQDFGSFLKNGGSNTVDIHGTKEPLFFAKPGAVRLWKSNVLNDPVPLTLSKGQVHQIGCLSGGRYHYSVYIPPSYSPQHPASVLIYMASHGNAKPLSTQVAERLGLISVGLTEAGDGDYDPVTQNRMAVMFDLQRRFRIRQHGFYFAGFSGGGRASIIGAVACPDECGGVLTIGAGFEQGLYWIDWPAIDIPIYFLSGKSDYNRVEIETNYFKQRKAGRTVTLGYHPGGHTYGTPETRDAAIRWLAAMSGNASVRE